MALDQKTNPNYLELLSPKNPQDKDYRRLVLKTVRNQIEEVPQIKDLPRITCPCGKMISIWKAYRCFYCRIFWCKSCAKQHFGKLE